MKKKEKKSELERDLDCYKRKSEWQNKIIVKMQEENLKAKTRYEENKERAEDFRNKLIDLYSEDFYGEELTKLREENKRLKVDEKFGVPLCILFGMLIGFILSCIICYIEPLR